MQVLRVSLALAGVAYAGNSTNETTTETVTTTTSGNGTTATVTTTDPTTATVTTTTSAGATTGTQTTTTATSGSTTTGNGTKTDAPAGAPEREATVVAKFTSAVDSTITSSCKNSITDANVWALASTGVAMATIRLNSDYAAIASGKVYACENGELGTAQKACVKIEEPTITGLSLTEAAWDTSLMMYTKPASGCSTRRLEEARQLATTDVSYRLESKMVFKEPTGFTASAESGFQGDLTTGELAAMVTSLQTAYKSVTDALAAGTDLATVAGFGVGETAPGVVATKADGSVAPAIKEAVMAGETTLPADIATAAGNMTITGLEIEKAAGAAGTTTSNAVSVVLSGAALVGAALLF